MAACLLLAALLSLSPSLSTAAEAPPPQPPSSILPTLTLNGSVPVQYYYVDDSNRGQGTHYKFSHDDITEMIKNAEAFVQRALAAPMPPPPSTPPHASWAAQLTDLWLVHALHRYPPSGKSVVVFGSTSPWYESIAIAMGASHVTVVEYNRLTYDHPATSTILASQLPREATFEVALSLSSFDHDGLGRYGDPINPNGDLVAMDTVASVLKPGGLLFLTVPLGPDVVVWNLHRRYGNKRLPLLLRGWEEVACVEWAGRLLDTAAPVTVAYEPVFVLRRPLNDS